MKILDVITPNLKLYQTKKIDFKTKKKYIMNT